MHGFRRAAAAIAVGISAGAAPAAAAPLDIGAQESFGILGEQVPFQQATASPAGDVNGDGVDDVVVNAPTYAGGQTANLAWVVFGRRGAPTDIDVRSTGDRGFAVVASGPRALGGVAPIGDVNGDGRDDLSAFLAPTDEALADWRSRVVLGSGSTAPVDLDALGTRGFAMPDDVALDARGRGDVNGDGADDVFAIRMLDPSVQELRGEYLFGAASLTGGASVGTVEARMARFAGSEPAGILGDVDGDGLDDLGDVLEGGDVAVLFGRRWAPGVIGVSTAERLRLPVNLPRAWPRPPVRGGDVNGDGRADVVVPVLGETDLAPGKVYVVFGRGPGTQDLEQLGAGGLTITGFVGSDRGTTGSASPAGDVDGDGRDELIVRGGGIRPHLLPGGLPGGTLDGTQLAQAGARPVVTGGEPAQLLTAVGDLDGNGGDDLAARLGAWDDAADPLRIGIAGGTDAIPPAITKFGLTNTTFRVGATPARVPQGTTVYGTLSEDVTLALSLRTASGTKITTVRGPATRGKQTMAFDGRVNGVALPPGGYQLIPVLTDGGGNTRVGPIATFTVVG